MVLHPSVNKLWFRIRYTNFLFLCKIYLFYHVMVNVNCFFNIYHNGVIKILLIYLILLYMLQILAINNDKKNSNY